MPETPRNVSVTAPLTPAIERVKKLLFQPFDLTVWLTVGLCAWLAQLGRMGGGGGGSGFRLDNKAGAGLEQALRDARDYVLANLTWIIPLAIGIVLLAMTIWLVLTWLSSRGDFMLLHCVAEKKSEATVPWTIYARHGNSLFIFRVVLGLLAFVLIAPIAALGVWMLDRTMTGQVRGLVGGLLVTFSFLSVVGVGLIFALAQKLTRDFVVPIMYLHTENCVVAWRRLLLLLTRHLTEFVLYVLFSIVLAVLIGLLVLAVVLVTCCCAGCLFAIPYLGTVFLLPIYVFGRAYSAEYLAQYGPDYNVFRWTV